MGKYYIITSYYSNQSTEIFTNRQDWLKAIDSEALDGAPGKGERFEVGYIDNDNYELVKSIERVNTYKKNGRGGYYHANLTSIEARLIAAQDQEDEDIYCDLEKAEWKTQKVGYYSIYQCENGDFDCEGIIYDTYEEALENNKPSQYLLI